MVKPFSRSGYWFVYEIYPQSETPHLTQIAHHDFDPSMDPQLEACLLPDSVIWYEFHIDRDWIVFRVWNYRLNHSTCFSVDVDFDNFEVYFFLSKALKLAFNSLVGR